MSGTKALVIAPYDPAWPGRFAEVGRALRARLGGAAERIDHVGSTSVPGLAAKDLIDVQVTVSDLGDVDGWADELLPGLHRRAANTADHIPPGRTAAPVEWAKRYWSDRQGLHVHVREEGRANQRYALLFRDYLRADPAAAGAYAELKSALARRGGGDWDLYYAVKDPACDIVMAGAEHWAAAAGWRPGPSDA